MKRYAIVGFGCAGYNGAKAIRELDPDCEIHVYEKTLSPPSNPMLTTYYVSGKLDYEGAFPFGDLDSIKRRLGLIFHGNERVSRVIPEERALLSESGAAHYDKILISTGARAILPGIAGLPDRRVFLMRTMEDAKRMQDFLESTPVKRAVVIGASMVGIKVAELLWKRGIETTIADFASWLFPLAAFEPVAREIERQVATRGIAFKWNSGIQEITPCGARFSDGQELNADIICMCIGTRANVELAANTGVVEGSAIQIGKGIVVDEHMQTSVPGIYAAGDCCEGTNLQTGKTMIIGLWANAGYQGACAGRNMAGAAACYRGNIVHNITYFMDMDFIGLGDNRADGTVITFGAPGSPLYIRAVKGSGGLACVNILGSCQVSGILKSFLLKQLAEGPSAKLPLMQRAMLRRSGLSDEWIDLLEGGIA